MALFTSHPQQPLPWGKIVQAIGLLWLAPVVVGLIGLALFMVIIRLGTGAGDSAMVLWTVSYALMFSPLFSWIGWALALLPVMVAVSRGWFGWGSAALIGLAAGLVAGAVVDSEIASAFGFIALVALRGLMGRMLPI